MKRLPREFIVPVINGTEGKFFGLYFYKKDGTLRKLNGHLQKDEPIKIDETGYITVWDRNKFAYRRAHIDKIVMYTQDNNNYKIV